MPFFSSDSSAMATGARRRTIGSVTTMTRQTFHSARSMPTSRVAPQPNRMLEVAISNAYSLLIPIGYKERVKIDAAIIGGGPAGAAAALALRQLMPRATIAIFDRRSGGA